MHNLAQPSMLINKQIKMNEDFFFFFVGGGGGKSFPL